MKAAQANSEISITNEKTGEVIEGVAAFIQQKQKNAFEAWSQLVCLDTRENNDGQLESIMNTMQGLKGESLRIFFAMLLCNGYRNEVMLGAEDLSDITGIALPNVYRGLRALAEAGFLERREREGKGRRGSAWFITQKMVWRGHAREHIGLVNSEKRKAAELEAQFATN